MTKKTLLEDALILSLARTARRLVHLLPPGVSLFIARLLGTLAYAAMKRRRLAYKNLRAAFAGELSRSRMKQIARRSMQNLAMTAIEMLRFPDLDRKYVEGKLEFAGTERFEPYLKEGKGIIFLTAHFGNWELLNAAGGILKYPMVSLARVQKHPRSDDFLNSLRTSQGTQIIRKGMPVREILRSLKKGGIVGILSDQDGGKNGTFVPFFRRLSSSPSGVATFAIRTGAPIFPVFIFRKRWFEPGLGFNGWDAHRIEVEGPLMPPDPGASPEEGERMILRQFAQALESKIRRSPEQWLWAHRRWKSTPDRSVLILSDGKSGHLNQSLAVLEAIRAERSARGAAPERTRHTVVEVRFRSPFAQKGLSALSILLGGQLPFKHWVLKNVLDDGCYRQLSAAYADIVISSGSSLAAVNLLVKQENDAKSVVVMKPPFTSKGFDAILAPRHDRMKERKNVFATDRALSRLTAETLREEGDKLSRKLGLAGNGAKIGLLLGGETDGIKFSRDLLEEALRGLDRYSRQTHSVLLATSSRRTPAWADEMLKKTFGDRERCPLLVIANESNQNGILGGILGLSDIVVVSGDSISMVSEAVSSGRPVVVFTPSDPARLKPRHREFLDRMAREKWVVPADARTIADVLGREAARAVAKPAERLSRDASVLREAVKRVL
ncbi:MAG: ELM1/GtrOC1 family putative glycosyltransferase [Candidatus Omnitrophota bacterium]